MIIIYGIVVIPMVIAAIFLLRGKGAFLIAGYNTASKEKKSRFDEKALCRFTGGVLLGISFGTLLIAVGSYLEMAPLAYFGSAIIVLCSIAAVVYPNTGNRFLKKGDSDTLTGDGDKNIKSSESKRAVRGAAVFTAIVIIAVGILTYQSEKDPVVSILDGSVQIKSMYGLNIDFSDISGISLIEENMNEIGIGKRINGYGGFGDTLKGNFRSNIHGEALLFVKAKSTPTLRIERSSGKDVYISFKNSEDTEALYREMIEKIALE